VNIVGERDPGLQPERTALSWHRTAFSSLVLALLIMRSGLVHDDRVCLTLGSIAAIFSLGLVFSAFHRHNTLSRENHLLSSSSLILKGLVCSVLGLNALALMLHSLPRLF